VAKSPFLTLFGLALAAVVSGAEIHGTITQNGKPLAQGTPVKLACGAVSASGETDEFGAYNLKIAATGECKLTVEAKGSSPSLPVSVYDKPSRYDLVLAEEAGKPVLRRR
jgi:hypothetical protein